MGHPPFITWGQAMDATRKDVLWTVFLMLGDPFLGNMIPMHKFKQYGGMLAGNPVPFFALQQSDDWDVWATDPQNASGMSASGPTMKFPDLAKAFAVPRGMWPTADANLAVGLLRVQEAVHPGVAYEDRCFLLCRYNGRRKYCYNQMVDGVSRTEMIYRLDWFCALWSQQPPVRVRLRRVPPQGWAAGPEVARALRGWAGRGGGHPVRAWRED